MIYQETSHQSNSMYKRKKKIKFCILRSDIHSEYREHIKSHVKIIHQSLVNIFAD